ncbi:MAG TPA: protein phosphatase 2C domain-containing protein [Terriglobales bacterium]
MPQTHRGISLSAARENPGGQTFSGSSMLELEFAELSDVGKVRGHNEDYLGHAAPASGHARERGWLFALADGVGGQDRGEVASRLAIETLRSGFQDYRPNESPAACLQRLVQAANFKICESASSATPGGSSMCTTVVACLLRFDRVIVGHVGDSRCYLIRRGQAEVLTQDHSLVGEQVRLGLISEEEAQHSERRHVLSRSLGANLFVNVELEERQLLAGDILLLSSDGLHGTVSGTEMAILTGQFHHLQEAAQALVSLAREKDGSDNISVQLIRVKNVERMGMYRGRPYKLR